MAESVLFCGLVVFLLYIHGFLIRYSSVVYPPELDGAQRYIFKPEPQICVFFHAHSLKNTPH